MGAILAAIAIFIALFFYERRAFKNVIFLGFIIVAIVLYFFSQNDFLLTEDNYVTGYLFAILFFLIPSIFLLFSFSMFFSSKILLEKEGMIKEIAIKVEKNKGYEELKKIYLEINEENLIFLN